MQELLAKYRRIMDAIYAGGDIWYDDGRKKAYELIALLASDLRQKGGAMLIPNPLDPNSIPQDRATHGAGI